MSSEAYTTFSLQTRINLFSWKGVQPGIMRTFKELEQDAIQTHLQCDFSEILGSAELRVK